MFEIVSIEFDRRRIYDVFLYNGEFDLLCKRLEELNNYVDYFVLVESNRTFTGHRKKILTDTEWKILQNYLPKIRYVLFNNENKFYSPWHRETAQRNSCVRGLFDLKDIDLVLLSDLDEFPSTNAIEKLKENFQSRTFSLLQATHYFYVNYRILEGPEANRANTVAFTKQSLSESSPQDLRVGMITGKIDSLQVNKAGWHFSYFMSEFKVIKKIQSFSHQEFNTFDFLKNLNIKKTIESKGDLFGRQDFKWELVAKPNLPRSFLSDPSFMKKYTYSSGTKYDFLKIVKNFMLSIFYKLYIFRLTSMSHKFIFFFNLIKAYTWNRPIIICPYNQRQDRIKFRRNFRINTFTQILLPIFFCLEEDLRNSTHTYEQTRSLFLDRDIIILNTDLKPSKFDFFNLWYFKLIYFSVKLENVGIIGASNLSPTSFILESQMFPKNELKEKIDNIEDLINQASLKQSKKAHRFSKITEPVWLPLCGSFISRRLLQSCGGIDYRNKKTYILDIDFSLKARIAGFSLYKVPVNLRYEKLNYSSGVMNQGSVISDFDFENVSKLKKEWTIVLKNWLELDKYL